MIETVIRIDVGVCVVAAEAIFDNDEPAVFLTICASELAWLINIYSKYCNEYRL